MIGCRYLRCTIGRGVCVCGGGGLWLVLAFGNQLPDSVEVYSDSAPHANYEAVLFRSGTQACGRNPKHRGGFTDLQEIGRGWHLLGLPLSRDQGAAWFACEAKQGRSCFAHDFVFDANTFDDFGLAAGIT